MSTNEYVDCQNTTLSNSELCDNHFIDMLAVVGDLFQNSTTVFIKLQHYTCIFNSNIQLQHYTFTF